MKKPTTMKTPSMPTIFDLVDVLASRANRTSVQAVSGAFTDQASELRTVWNDAAEKCSDLLKLDFHLESEGATGLFEAAVSGDPTAQFEVGRRYIQGDKLPDNKKLGLEWLLQAVESEQPNAMLLLGAMLKDGVGIKRDVSAAEDILLRASEAFRKSGQAETIPNGNCFNLLGLMYRAESREAESADAFQKALGIYEQVGDSAAVSRAIAEMNWGLLDREVGRLQQAEEKLRRSLDTMRRHFQEESAIVASAINNLAECLLERETFGEAEANFRLAIQLRKSLHGWTSSQVAASLIGLGSLFERQEKFDESEQRYRQAIEIESAVSGADSVEVAIARNNLAGVLYRRGDLSAAAKEQGIAVNSLRQHDDLGHYLAAALTMYGKSLRALGKLNYARPVLEEAVQIHRSKLGATHTDFATCLSNLAQLDQQEGKFADAEKLLNEELEFQLGRYGEQHRSVIVARNNLGTLFESCGRYQEAFEQLSKAVYHDQNHASISFARRLSNLAVVQRRLEKLDDAEASFIAAIEVIDAYGLTDSDVGIIRSNYGILLQKTGRNELAIQQFELALASFESTVGKDSIRYTECEMNLASVRHDLKADASLTKLFQKAAEVFRSNFGEADIRYLVAKKNELMSKANAAIDADDILLAYAARYGTDTEVYRSLQDTTQLTVTESMFAAA